MTARRVVQLLAPIVVGVVLGPLVAGIAVWLVAIAISPFGANTWPWTFADYRGMLVFFTIMAYFVGSPVALLAGFLVSLWMIRRPPNALIVNAAAVIATAAFMGFASLGLLGAVEETNGRSNRLFVLVFAVAAANICWLLMRRFALKTAPGGAK